MMMTCDWALLGIPTTVPTSIVEAVSMVRAVCFILVHLVLHAHPTFKMLLENEGCMKQYFVN